MSRQELPDRAGALRILADLADRQPLVGPQAVDRPLVLYGAGNLGRLAAGMLAHLDIPVAYAIDRAPPEDELLLGSIPVFRPEAAPRGDHRSHLVAVCVVLAPYTPIEMSLREMGWRHVRPFYDVAEVYSGRVPLNNGWFAGGLDADDVTEIGRVLDAWGDDWSRAAHLQFLAWRVHREEWCFTEAPVTTNDRYFIPPVVDALGSQECFLDAGAWHGVVSERFLAETGGRFREVVAVEPDRENVRRLRDWLDGLSAVQAARIRVLEYALAEDDVELDFANGHDMTSRIMPGSPERVPARALDGLEIPCTFLKFHLEGGELEALRGGLKTIRDNRPIMAITVYHNRDGLWRTAAFLMDQLGDYRFLFRVHAWCGTGAVLYALPNERTAPLLGASGLAGSLDDSVSG